MLCSSQGCIKFLIPPPSGLGEVYQVVKGGREFIIAVGKNKTWKNGEAISPSL